MLPSSQRERRVSRLNRTGKNTTGWARRLTALLVTACLVMAMALPVYAEVDLLPDAPDEVELLEDEQGTASGEDTVPPEQNAATPVPDAATPEPEQSAEPEQPAPTETLEPTAEPTPTPEPAATATATPVPTVTPTATPEPTEQPQKMYAAESVDNVQAVSEPEAADGFTVYFVVPDTINGQTVLDSDEIKFNVKTEKTPGNSDNVWWHPHSMEWTGWEKNGHKIYAVKNCKDILGNKFLEIQFQLCDSLGWKAQITLNNNLGLISSYNNRMYDPTANNNTGEWTDNPILTSYTYYADKTIKFENRSTANLTDVKANFYIPDETGTLTTPVKSSEAQTVAGGGVASFIIPKEPCSYVQFTWGGDGHSKFYNFYNESVRDDKESFLYSETSNCFIYTGADNVRWGIEKSFPIYYDATFSKMALTGDTGNFSIPRADQSTVYYLLKKGDGPESIGGPMSRIKGTDYYVADVPDGYTQIVFSSYPLSDDNKLATCGDTTGWETIPSDYQKTEQCFYADTNDDAVYSKGTRGGYWALKDTTPRDAEKGKSTGTKVVDIESAPFTEEANTKYVTSTLYDYYTDYELNGNNRGSYDQKSSTVSHRNWVPFREFDQALSDYYEKAGAQYPIYTGHFQPGGGTNFSDIASTLNLFGYNNVKRFMAINNSQYNEDPNNNSNGHTNYAYQGLVKDKTSTGNADGAPLLNGTEKATVEPHFNKEFLLGENSKKAKLGDVYDNVAFPFTKKQIFDEDQGVDYWCFDSKDTTLYLKQNSEQNSDSKYFLQESTDKRDRSLNVDSSSNSQGQYGYFPFNETATPHVASTYNYGFGTKLQMDFTLTDDGMVKTEKTDGTTEKTSIKFFFSGDDDVWVFIDGKLALDVGGAHGEVSGLLEFGESKKDKNKNSVTAYVSKVKTGGTSGSDQDGEIVKTVKYNGEDINFCAKGTTLDDLDKGQKHTLTMYYMERGMWESNMAVAFNFPDNNELQVQKEVELKNVNPAFQDCFKNQKIFNFTIQNQATHYGTKPAAGPNESENPSQHVDLTKGVDIAAATPNKENEYIFRLDENPKQPDPGHEGEKVLHWYARYTDTEPVSYWRKQRYGILTLENPIDIEKMRFLTFQVYTDSKDDGGDLSLNNLYLELLDDKEVQKGSLGTTGINGATYGSVELETGKWVTVKLDLNKMKKQDGFNNKVKFIRVGDNYSRHIYFRNFTFIPKAVPSKMTGFTTDQEKIPDYHSVESGKLENAENAQYTSNMDTDTQLVDGDGRFVLEDGETVTFSDQFRRGSYISLKEELNRNLYDTTWTVCENGQAVTSMKGDSESVTVTDTNKSLDKQEGSSPNDGRTEKIRPNDDQTGNNYTGTKPKGDTIVFRSYKDPDETSSTLTKLKVKYVNTVKTGGLKIQKKAAAGEENTIKGTYTFKVTFNDVGGEGLEEKPIEKIVTINMSEAGDHTKTITGIPVGTRYTIEEVTPQDGSRLQSVTVPDGNEAHVINNTMVEGMIVASENLGITAIFTNTQRKLINIEFDKLWEDANGTVLGTTNQPNEIYIQLQRKNSAADAQWEVVDYPTSGSKYVTVRHTDNGWLYPFNNLDQYPVGGSADNNYIYRIVEGTVEKGEFKQAAENGTITIDGKTYVVKAEATAKSEKDSETGATTTPATVTPDGTITGGSGKIVLTNTLQNPKFVLDIIKKDAEKGENGEDVPLSGVEFKLEKLKAETTGGEPQVDTTYEFNDTNTGSITTGSITATTNGSGEITNMFTDLEPGTYRLTETKAHAGYNLLSKPIDITFEDGKCSIDGVEVKKDGNTFKDGPNNTYTMTLTVLNRKTPELPHTGADAPSLWLLIGMPLAVAGLLIFTFRYNRKGGRRH